MVHADPQESIPPPPTSVTAGSPSLFKINKEEWVRSGYEFMNRALDFGERTFHRALGSAAAVTREGTVGGLCGMMARMPFTPETILLGYAQGMFPMDQRGKIYWHCPDPRCVVPLDQLHIPSRIARYLKKGLFELCFDRDPAAVLANCGDRTETWLSQRIQTNYVRLFEMGALHTVEAYNGPKLVGGAFGVGIGSVFTIESMFSHEDHASKLAFAYLCQHLAKSGYTLADCQYQSPHVERFGAVEMPRKEYRERVARGLIHPGTFKR